MGTSTGVTRSEAAPRTIPEPPHVRERVRRVERDERADPQDLDRTVARAVSAMTGRLGSPAAIFLAIAVVAVWALAGPIFGFSQTWQLVINTFTTVLTFLMVFVIQNSQNRDARAIHTKLDDILGAFDATDDGLAGIEDEPEEEIKRRQIRQRQSS
jgi:low affinity Fe/Cu permease